MSDFQNDIKRSVADAKAAAVGERRRLVARLFAWLRDHPHTIMALAAAAAALVLVLAFARG